MISAEDIFRDFLRKKGLKFTPERSIILKNIISLNKHIDADEFYEYLAKKKKHPSRASVYRTLPLLEEAGLLSKSFRFQNKVTYEYILGREHHDHLLCVKCGKIIEFRNNKIEKLQDEVCKKHNFKPIFHRLIIRGLCEDCQRKEKR